MKKKKKLISVVATSCVALCLCTALLAGSTFAWFTDTLVSSGNIIKAGNINIDGTVYYESANGGVTVAGEDNGDFTITPIVSAYDMDEDNTSDAIGETGLYGYGERTLSFDMESGNTGNLNEQGAITGTHDKDIALEVEPGKSYARLIKLENTGTIDAVAKFNFSAGGDLADEMWFYLAEVVYDADTEPSLTINSGASFIPESIDEINNLEDENLTKEFSLKADAAEDKWVVLVFGVYASAGNGVQGQSLDLTMTVLATQDVGHSSPDDPVKADYAEWTGVTDTSWIPSDMAGAATTDGVRHGNHDGETYTIYTPAQLGGLAYFCNHTTQAFTNVTVKLGADMDLGGYEWTPIGLRHADAEEAGTSGDATGSWHGFFGDFDGDGYTIYNLSVQEGHEHDSEYTDSDWESNYNHAGLFSRLWGGKIENVTIHNADVKGAQGVGVLVGTAGAGTTGANNDGTPTDGEYVEESGTIHTSITNCHVEGLIKVTADHEAGGLIGHASDVHLENCSVEGVAGSYVRSEYVDDDDHDGDNAGGLVGFMGTTSATYFYTGVSGTDKDNLYTAAAADVVPVIGCDVKGLVISGTRKVGGIVGYAQCMVDLSGCSVTDCDVGLVYNENATLSGGNLRTQRLFVGAFVGEYDMTVNVSGTCTTENVSVSYFEAWAAGSRAVDEKSDCEKPIYKYRGKTGYDAGGSSWETNVYTDGLFGGCKSSFDDYARISETESGTLNSTDCFVTLIQLSY